MATRAELLSARQELHEIIRASEEWQPSYKHDQTTFRRLVTNEARLTTAASEYLYGLSERAVAYVDWTRLPQVNADNGPVINNDDPAWKQEMALLTAALLDLLIDTAQAGASAGAARHDIPMNDTLDEAVQRYARTRTAQMVSQVTSTTRDLIRESIRQSIASGENTAQAIERLRKVINNPVRADMIARTEAVNAYQGGYSEFAKGTGAVSKTWDGLATACLNICAPVSGKTIPIDEQFTLGNGEQVDQPAAHVYCRCGIIYNY